MNDMARWARLSLVLGLALLAGCGSGAPARRVVPGRPTASGACARQDRLSAGVPFAGWHMGAIHFLSAAVGIGVSAAALPCDEPVRGGFEVSPRAVPVRLAISRDGGRRWLLAGRALPIAPTADPVVAEQVVASSLTRAWVLTGRGTVLSTGDGGSTWTTQPLPHPVLQLALGEGVVWALACPPTVEFLCRPVLERTRGPGGAWVRVATPPLTSEPDPQLALASGEAIVIATGAHPDGPGELVSSTDGGRHWVKRQDPSWAGGPCTGSSGLATAGASRWWLLCLGAPAAGSSTLALLGTADAGRTWKTLSQVTSLASPERPGAIPPALPTSFAAGSPRRLWLADLNLLAESADGGSSWTRADDVDPEGASAAFDVLSPARAWLLAAGEGMWATSDGNRWRAISPPHTG